MSVLSTRNKLDLAAVFMSLALTQPAGAAVPFNATGHVDWLPVYGAGGRQNLHRKLRHQKTGGLVDDSPESERAE